jgi:hypothetical protein
MMMDMRGISRRKTNWLVRCVYKDSKPLFQKMFADQHFGGRDAALEAAIEYRDSVVGKEKHDIGQRRRMRCESTGFIREPDASDYIYVHSFAEKLIRGRRFKAIRSDVAVEELCQSALLAYATISSERLVDKYRYLRIQVGLAIRSMLLNFKKRSARFSTGLNAVEGGRSRFVKL